MTMPLRHEGLVRLLALPTLTDHRGNLTPITFADWGFAALRSFVVTAPAGSVRGGHAHRVCRQVLMRVSGVVDVDVRLGDLAETVRLDDSTPAVLVEAGVWARQTYVTDDAALVVFADLPYDPDDYVDADPADSSPPRRGGRA
jgi:dTDP-4-dehydrorhamnose 3,5-epimerase-like enzyme